MFSNSPERKLEIGLFPLTQNVQVNSELFVEGQGGTSDFFALLPDQDSINLVPRQLEGASDYEKLLAFDDQLLAAAQETHYDYVAFLAFRLEAHQYQVAAFVNTTA